MNPALPSSIHEESLIEAAVREAIASFGLKRFAMTLTTPEQGPLGAPAAD